MHVQDSGASPQAESSGAYLAPEAAELTSQPGSLSALLTILPHVIAEQRGSQGDILQPCEEAAHSISEALPAAELSPAPKDAGKAPVGHASAGPAMSTYQPVGLSVGAASRLQAHKRSQAHHAPCKEISLCSPSAGQSSLARVVEDTNAAAAALMAAVEHAPPADTGILLAQAALAGPGFSTQGGVSQPGDITHLGIRQPGVMHPGISQQGGVAQQQVSQAASRSPGQALHAQQPAASTGVLAAIVHMANTWQTHGKCATAPFKPVLPPSSRPVSSPAAFGSAASDPTPASGRTGMAPGGSAPAVLDTMVGQTRCMPSLVHEPALPVGSLPCPSPAAFTSGAGDPSPASNHTEAAPCEPAPAVLDAMAQQEGSMPSLGHDPALPLGGVPCPFPGLSFAANDASLPSSPTDVARCKRSLSILDASGGPTENPPNLVCEPFPRPGSMPCSIPTEGLLGSAIHEPLPAYRPIGMPQGGGAQDPLGEVGGQKGSRRSPTSDQPAIGAMSIGDASPPRELQRCLAMPPGLLPLALKTDSLSQGSNCLKMLADVFESR